MSIRIAIADEQAALPVDRRWLRRVVRMTLQAEGVRAAQVSIALVTDPAMHDLNRRHLQHDYPTDVLSFLLSAPPSDEPDADGVAAPLEGELIVSTDTAVRQAAEYGWPPDAELTLYIVHGVLHLCGHDDHTTADRRRMRARERAILQTWGLTPHYE
jgi:probable rRNA maturation factor